MLIFLNLFSKHPKQSIKPRKVWSLRERWYRPIDPPMERNSERTITTNAPLHLVSGGVEAEESLTAAERSDEQLPDSVRHVAHVGDHPRASLVVPPAAARPVRPGRICAAVQPPHLLKINISNHH